MIAHRIACCVALAAGFVLTIAQAAACDRVGCRPKVHAASPGAPLPLDAFMRWAARQSTVDAANTTGGVRKYATHSRQIRRHPASAPAKPIELPSEAALAFASQEFTAQAAARVRMVHSDELNEIDMAADPSKPAPENQDITDAVQLVSAEELNEIDRKLDDTSPQTSVTVGGNLVESSGGHDSTSWFERVVATLRWACAAAVSSAARWLAG